MVGWAMAISAVARSRMERPRSSATPHSVTTLSTVFLIVVTTSPAARVGAILEMRPLAVVECSTTNPWPPGEYMAPRAKSA